MNILAHGHKLKSATSGIVLFTGIINIKATSPQRSNFIVHVQTSQETVENAVKLNIEWRRVRCKVPVYVIRDYTEYYNV